MITSFFGINRLFFGGYTAGFACPKSRSSGQFQGVLCYALTTRFAPFNPQDNLFHSLSWGVASPGGLSTLRFDKLLAQPSLRYATASSLYGDLAKRCIHAALFRHFPVTKRSKAFPRKTNDSISLFVSLTANTKKSRLKYAYPQSHQLGDSPLRLLEHSFKKCVDKAKPWTVDPC